MGALVAFGACARSGASAPVLTTVYPAQFLAERLTGGSVPNLAPVGAEPHDLELSPRQVDELQAASLVVAWSPGFQPVVDEALRTRTGQSVTLTDALDGSDRTAAERDPHVWLDPVLMRSLAGAMNDALNEQSLGDGASRAERLRALDEELAALDAQYRAGLANCSRRVIVTSHEAFGWLAQRYGFTQFGIAGIDPETEPNAQRIADIADVVREQQVTTIFTEEQVSSRIAATLARESNGVRVATLATLESLTAEQQRSKATYFTLMRENLTKLQAAMGCS